MKLGDSPHHYFLFHRFLTYENILRVYLAWTNYNIQVMGNAIQFFLKKTQLIGEQTAVEVGRWSADCLEGAGIGNWAVQPQAEKCSIKSIRTQWSTMGGKWRVNLHGLRVGCIMGRDSRGDEKSEVRLGPACQVLDCSETQIEQWCFLHKEEITVGKKMRK